MVKNLNNLQEELKTSSTTRVVEVSLPIFEMAEFPTCFRIILHVSERGEFTGPPRTSRP